jgi:HEAT repeat protein
VRLHIPRTVSRFGSQRAADLLTSFLAAESDGAVRYKVLRGLGSLVARHDVTLDRKAIEHEIERNLVESLRLLARSVPLELEMNDPSAAAGLGRQARASGRLLLGLLEDKRNQAVQRAFRLFQLIHRREDVRGIFLALRSADPGRRAAAAEFLDGLAAQGRARCRALFALVADDLDPEERVVRAAAFVPEPPEHAALALRLLMTDPDTAVAGLAAYHVNRLHDPALRAELDELCTERPSLGLFGELNPAPSSSARARAVELP